MPYNPQRDRILRTYRFPRPTSLHNTITETFAHLVRVRTIRPVYLDTAAHRYEPEHIIAINRVTTFSQFKLQSFQILVNHQYVLFRCRFLLCGLQIIPFGTPINNFIVRIAVPFLLFDVFIQNLVHIQSAIGNPLIKFRHVLESQTLDEEGLASAIRIMKESHADALKLEGGEEIIDTVKRIVCAGIPVMGHLGLMPQSINKYGTYTVRAKDEAEADKLIRDAHLLEEAGCFAIVLEKIPATLAERVASELTIPIIGIGAGGHVDGQVLVIQDMLGMNNGFRPRFLRRYADLYTVMTDAISRYVSDVKNCYFPNEKEQY